MKEDMEQKELNLCEILKGHEDEVFYSPIWGDTKFVGISHMREIVICPSDPKYNQNTGLDSKGRMNPNGEPMLYPSKKAFKNDDFEASWEAWAEENEKVTYEDIEKCLAKQFWCGIENIDCTSKTQLDKLCAINKLMNVQKYIEKGWQPDWKDAEQHKYYITAQDKGISIGYVVTICHSTVFFSSEENAHQAYKILGEDVIRQALSTDW